MYIIFRIKEEKQNYLLSQFLLLWFRRKEFLRSTLFFSSGSVRDTFDFQDMCRVKIPLPPLPQQQAIVNIYNCIEKSKDIIKRIDNILKNICPALIKLVENENE